MNPTAGPASAAGRSSSPAIGLAALVGLAASVGALTLAPLALDPSYDWVRHTTSESGAQGADGAWVARTGFALLGLSVLAVAARAADRWGQPGVTFHRVFGVGMVAVAVWSIRSWDPAVAFDPMEDTLHSIGATVVGFAFAVGVASVSVRLRMAGAGWRILDVVAVVASVVLPLAMAASPEIDGVLQRILFGLAYLWFAREALNDGGFGQRPSRSAEDSEKT